jgi:hypothetical protein
VSAHLSEDPFFFSFHSQELSFGGLDLCLALLEQGQVTLLFPDLLLRRDQTFFQEIDLGKKSFFGVGDLQLEAFDLLLQLLSNLSEIAVLRVKSLSNLNKK